MSGAHLFKARSVSAGIARNDDIRAENKVPMSLQSMVTQVDKDSEHRRLAEPVNDWSKSSSSSNSNNNNNNNIVARRPSFFHFIFKCCGSRIDISEDNRNVSKVSRESQHNRDNVELSRNSSGALNNAPGTDQVYNQSDHNAIIRQQSHNYGRPLSRPEMGPPVQGKKCLVLDLDETLVHSSFTPVAQAHYIIPVTLDEGVVHDVYVTKRPGVDAFIKKVSESYEVVIYTASISRYADPLLDRLDLHRVISKRLFRENCVFHEGHYVKDLSLLNRDLKNTIIVDNSPMSYKFHPENAIDCTSFFDDPKDFEMWQIGDFLSAVKSCDDVRVHCNRWREFAPAKNYVNVIANLANGNALSNAAIVSPERSSK